MHAAARLLTSVGKVINQDDFSDKRWRRAVENAEYGSFENGLGLVVEDNYDAGIR